MCKSLLILSANKEQLAGGLVLFYGISTPTNVFGLRWYVLGASKKNGRHATVVILISKMLIISSYFMMSLFGLNSLMLLHCLSNFKHNIQVASA